MGAETGSDCFTHCLQSPTSCFPILLLLRRSGPHLGLIHFCLVTPRAAPIKKRLFAQQPTGRCLSELTAVNCVYFFEASVCFRFHCCHKQACSGRPWLGGALSLSEGVTPAVGTANSLVTAVNWFVIWTGSAGSGRRGDFLSRHVASFPSVRVPAPDFHVSQRERALQKSAPLSSRLFNSALCLAFHSIGCGCILAACLPQ